MKFIHLITFFGALNICEVNTITWSADWENVMDILNSFKDRSYSASAVIIMHFKGKEKLMTITDQSHHGLWVNQQAEVQTNLTDILQTKYYPLVVVVDMESEEINLILQQASNENLFSPLHHWLMFSNNITKSIRILEETYLPINSHITLAYENSTTKRIILQDVYQVGRNQSLIISSPLNWNLGQAIPREERRTDYRGISIPTVVVLAQGTWKDFADMQYRHLNTESKVQYILMTSIAEMLNFRITPCFTNTWGYPINGSRCFNGAVGLLQCGNCEIGATGLLFKTERMPVIDYAGETLNFRGAFMFLRPSLSEVSVIYELPFSTSVWITYVGTVTVLTIVLQFTRHVHQHVSSSKKQSISWSDTIMDSLAIVCQQDALHSPKNVSSRIVFISMLVLTVFVLTSYSAIIVSLLQTSSDTINTLSDLMKSPLKLSMIDIFVNETTDPEVTRVFKEKLYTQPFKEAFTTEDVGIEKIRRGLYAYHGLSGSYKIISDTYEEHEKCRFKEITMFTSLHLSFTARKHSPYIQHIKERTCWLREVGLVDHEDKRWFYQKPKCESEGQNFVSVGIQDFYPALAVLACGILGSIWLFFLELLYFKKEKFNCCSAVDINIIKYD